MGEAGYACDYAYDYAYAYAFASKPLALDVKTFEGWSRVSTRREHSR